MNNDVKLPLAGCLLIFFDAYRVVDTIGFLSVYSSAQEVLVKSQEIQIHLIGRPDTYLS
jgi:hypothetical protein